MYVYYSIIHNSKDIKPTQMPINDSLNKENVVYINHEIFNTHSEKKMRSCPLQGHGEAGSHWHPQQTNADTENQTLNVLIHKWELNNENTWTQGGEQHTLGPLDGEREGRATRQIVNACRA